MKPEVLNMKQSEWESHVVKHIDTLSNELVELCQDLIRIPSWDRETRGEAEVAHRVGKTLENRNIPTEYVASHENIDNLIATWQAKKGGRRLLFNGHVDVVPPGEDWTIDPFAAEIRDGYIFGRGAMDMKGGVAAMTMAVCALRDLEVPLNGTIIVNAVGDEERQGRLGTTWCIENAWKKIKADAAIIPEPSGLGPLGYAVNIGEKGPVWLRITTKGEKAHGSVPAAGRNAISLMLNLLHALQETNLPTTTPPISRKSIEGQIAEALGVEPKALAGLLRGEGNPIAAGLEALTTTTMNIGVINGGSVANVVPDRCECQIDFRILPGQQPQEMFDFVYEQATKLNIAIHVDVEFIEAIEGNSIPNHEQNEIVTTMYRTSKEIVGPTVYFLVPFATDARLLRRAGLISSVVYGPGNMTQAHVADENISIEHLIKVTKVHALSALRFLGVKG
jgi:acetylornithine deacetylase/succinyl-diaminopimelate desuccinylase family protein